MTADVELLPLPDEFADKIEVYVANPFARPTIIGLAQAYARANVEHRTEALRAEVERLKELVRSVGYETLTRAEKAEARAERLAEAINAVLADMSEWGEPAKGAHILRVINFLSMALHPAAAQEGKESFWPKLPGSGGPDWTGHD